MSSLLTRFYEYDDNKDDDSPSWIVSGSALEGFIRYYRIMYEDKEKKQFEFILDTGTPDWNEHLAIFVYDVLAWIQVDAPCQKCCDAVHILFSTDPWLSEVPCVINVRTS